MLDRLMRIKPKALDLVYEGIIMFNRNKTAEWRNDLSPERLKVVMEKARLSVREQKRTYFLRKEIIRQKRMEKLTDAKTEKERKQRVLAAEKEKLVILLNEIGSLWDVNTIDKSLENFHSVQDKRSVLKIQLQFRQKVHNVKCVFFLSSGGKVKTFQELVLNLKKVCNWTSDVERFSEVIPDTDFSKAIELSDAQLSTEKTRLQTEEKKISNYKNPSCGQNKRSDKVKAKPVSAKKQTDKDKLPVISSPGDLVGKLISHFCDTSDEDDINEYKSNKGVVLKRFGTSKKNFLIQYFELPEETFIRSAYSDFVSKESVLVGITVGDFVGAHVEHLFVDVEMGKEVWLEAEVVDVDEDSVDKNNPEFFVFYYENGEDPEGDPEYFLEKMLEEYLNGCVQFLEVPSK